MSRKERIAARAQSLVDAGRFAGIEWQVTQGGAPFDAGKVGMSDPAGGVAMPDVPIYRIYSMTKPIVSAAAMMLFEEGRLRLTDPVADYIPGCASPTVLETDGTLRPARTPMTLEHLFTHRAGLSYGFIPGCPVASIYRDVPFAKGTLESFTDLFSSFPIAFDPGTAYRYSHSTDFLGRVVEVASGQRLDAFLSERIFKPLGLTDTGFMVPEGERHRVMAMFGEPDINKTTDVPDGPQTLTPADVSTMYPVDDPNYVWGGHGLFSTANDYMKIAGFLASGRAGAEVLLSPAGTRALWRNRIPAHQMPLSVGADLMPGYGWGLAGRVMMDAGAFPGYTSDGEFGWAGAAATYFWVDPARDVTGVVMTQYLGAQVQLSDIMRDAVYQALEV